MNPKHFTDATLGDAAMIVFNLIALYLVCTLLLWIAPEHARPWVLGVGYILILDRCFIYSRVWPSKVTEEVKRPISIILLVFAVSINTACAAMLYWFFIRV